MAYCAQVDVEDACGGPDRALQMLDWDGDGVIDAARLASAIASADAMIDSYIGKQYLVPLPVVPITIKECSARIAVFKALSARSMAGQNIVDQYERDEKWLARVASGEVTLGIEPFPTPGSLRVDSVSERPSGKAVSRKKLYGFR